MTTARDLISASLRKIGVLAKGETMLSEDANDGLIALNGLLSSWSVDRLNIYALTQESFALTIGTASYTIGVGGVFNTVRPIKVIESFIRDGQLDYPLTIQSQEFYDQIGYKTTRTIPAVLFLDYAYPLATVKLYPVPDKAYTLFLTSQKALAAFATLDAIITLPDGYERTLTYNLAVEMCPEYGISAPIEVAGNAVSSKAIIKRINSPIPLVNLDGMLDYTQFNQYNIEAG